jgi:hypothetical protein
MRVKPLLVGISMMGSENRAKITNGVTAASNMPMMNRNATITYQPLKRST